jgi:hypothetical protein
MRSTCTPRRDAGVRRRTPGTTTPAAPTDRPASLGGRDRCSTTGPRRSGAALYSSSTSTTATPGSSRRAGTASAVEVGPLARMLMLYATGAHAQARSWSTHPEAARPADRALFSTLGRTAARTLESKLVADAMHGWYDAARQHPAGDTKTFNETLWDPSTWPAEAQGVGIMEAPRGALGHWIVIKDGKIANYQAVVPSAPGTPAPAIHRISPAPTRRRCRTPRAARAPSSRSRSCARSTASTPASPAPCTWRSGSSIHARGVSPATDRRRCAPTSKKTSSARRTSCRGSRCRLQSCSSNRESPPGQMHPYRTDRPNLRRPIRTSPMRCSRPTSAPSTSATRS